MNNNRTSLNLSAVVVEDHKIASIVLLQYCQKAGVELRGVFANAQDAIPFLQAYLPDIVFIDIGLPDMSGFDMMQRIPPACGVVFTTSDTDHALKAHEYDILDFLVKPITYERFCKSLDRVYSRQYLLKQKNEDAVDFMLFKSDGIQVKLPIDQIIYLEAKGDYIKIVTAQKQYFTLHTMKEMKDKLLGKGITQVHRSFLINVDKITAYKSGVIILEDVSIPVSRPYREYVKQELKVKKLP